MTASKNLSKTSTASKNTSKTTSKKSSKSLSKNMAKNQYKIDKIDVLDTVTNSMVKRLQEGGFILLGALAIFLLLALFTYHEADPGWSHVGTYETLHNAAGKTGAWISDLFLFLFGYIAYLFPVILAYAGFRLYQNRLQLGIYTRLLWILRIAGFVVAVVAGCGLATLQMDAETESILTKPASNGVLFNPSLTGGGILGRVVVDQILTFTAFGQLGSTLLLIALFLAGITLATGLSWFGVMDTIGIGCLTLLKQLRAEGPKIFAAIKQLFAKYGSISKKFFVWLWKLLTFGFLSGRSESANFDHAMRTGNKSKSESKTTELVLFNSSKDKRGVKTSKNNASATSSTSTTSTSTCDDADDADFLKFSFLGKKKNLSESGKTRSSNTTQSSKSKSNSKSSLISGETILPDVNLLEEASPTEKQHPLSFSPHKLEALSREVESRLLEFSVQVTVVAVLPGPVITRFELELAPGIKVSKITGLAKDLARALSVTRVRVVEVIPGKSVVGLEIPNEHRELVRLREIFESTQYQDSSSPLTLALGKDISGEPVVANLSKMPHLLVAGTTGSGKSVGVNAMLLSLLYKATAEEVRLILIDPKMLELSIYDGIPHLLTPVVTDMKDAANVLRWCVGEMERRYQLMAAVGVRNLSGYNRKVLDAAAEGKILPNPLWKPEMGGDCPPLELLPYIVVIIDEFADMIMVVGKKVEELIARIAQKARAAGIHMILATQRPSVDVITGLIKANVPTRIAYQVSSRIDSRTILDQQGAEQLLGHGDMLYLPPGTGIPVRIHGAFVSDEEVHSVVKHLKQHGEPSYTEDILGSHGSSGGGFGNFGNMGSGSFGSGGFGSGGFDGEGDGEQDELYDQAVQIIMETRKTSISHLQRRLKIGYNRAARLIETMEMAGLLSAIQANGSREVLVGSQTEE